MLKLKKIDINDYRLLLVDLLRELDADLPRIRGGQEVRGMNLLDRWRVREHSRGRPSIQGQLEVDPAELVERIGSIGGLGCATTADTGAGRCKGIARPQRSSRIGGTMRAGSHVTTVPCALLVANDMLGVRPEHAG